MKSNIVKAIMMSMAFAGAFNALAPQVVSATTLYADAKFVENLIPGRSMVYGVAREGVMIPNVEPNQAFQDFGAALWMPSTPQMSQMQSAPVQMGH